MLVSNNNTIVVNSNLKIAGNKIIIIIIYI